MTITVNIADADLSELLAKVEASEEVILVRGNVPVARVSAMARAGRLPTLTNEDRATRRALIDTMLAERSARASTTAAEIDEWKKEGRR